MKLKTLSKLYMWTKLIKQCLLAAMVINMFIFVILFFPAVLLSDLFFIKIEKDMVSILCAICLIFIMVYQFNDFLYKKLSLNISDDYKSIIFYLVNRKHKFIKLNLEIEKLAKAFNNHSNVYNELNNNDFPYLNKFLRRAAFLFENNPNPTDETNTNVVQQGISINTRNLEKLQLRLSDNPKLLTLDSVDNGLNDLINSRLTNLHHDKCLAKNDKCS